MIRVVNYEVGTPAAVEHHEDRLKVLRAVRANMKAAGALATPLMDDAIGWHEAMILQGQQPEL